MRLVQYVIFLGFSLTLAAQLTLEPLRTDRRVVQQNKPTFTTNDIDPIQLPFVPFWDDFSVSKNTVDSIRVWGTDTILQWDLREGQSRGVFVNSSLAITPPTYNVATFDGLDDNGGFYSTELNANGETDRLVSYPMDLTGASNVFLSFYWQAGGNVEKPDNEDFIRLVIEDLNSGITNDTVIVWQQSGGNQLDETVFQQELIAIPSQYLSDSVRFLFSASGDQDGPFDAWHLDWIYLNSGRSSSDLVNGYRDGALTGQLSSPFFPFNSVPANQFVDNSIIRNQEITLSYLNQVPGGRENTFLTFIDYVITNSNNGEVILNDPNRAGPFLSSSLNDTTVTIGLTDPNLGLVFLNEQDFSSILSFDSVVLRSEVLIREDPLSSPILLNNTIVDLRVNDTVRENYTLHNYYAFDDGTAEYAAGTNIRNAQVAVQFWVQQPDTLTHIDINFPNIAPNQNGGSISLNVFSELDTTGILRSQQVQVINNASRDAFTRYTLNQPVIVSDTFFIGYQQFINDFLAIGFDRSNPEASQYIFENASTEWVQNISLRGALMIRPVFGQDTLSALVLGQEDPLEHSFEVYPNPTTGSFHIEGIYDHMELLNLSGRILSREPAQESHRIPSANPGLYLLRIYRNNQVETRKIILR